MKQLLKNDCNSCNYSTYGYTIIVFLKNVALYVPIVNDFNTYGEKNSLKTLNFLKINIGVTFERIA